MDKNLSSPEVHHRIYAIRAALDLTQREMSKALGYSETFINRLESKLDCTITLNLILSICSIFNVRYEYLVHGEEPMFDTKTINQKRLLEIYDQLSEYHKQYAIEFLDYLLSKEQKESQK